MESIIISRMLLMVVIETAPVVRQTSLAQQLAELVLVLQAAA
jgi:hypothetical protein